MASSSSSASQAGPSDAHYPSWPHIDDAAEYWEIPPDHFLAQQGAAAKGRSASPEASTSTSVLSSSPSDYDHHHHHHEPLAELASALPDGIASFALQGPGPVPVPAHGEEGDMPDTSTLAAADFDIDVRSGFLPPEAPVSRLEGVEGEWWETALEQAHRIGLKQGGGGPAITQTERRAARRWRRAIREMPVLPPSTLLTTEIRHARRGHLVLSFLVHFYIHSQPAPSPEPRSTLFSWRSYLNWGKMPADDLQDIQDEADERAGRYASTVPASLAAPWVRLSQQLGLPPVLTYATTVLWNWTYIDPSKGLVPGNVRMLESFTGTPSEEHFYLSSLLIEMRGVEALELMRVSLDEAFVSDAVARRRIAAYLRRLAFVVDELSQILHDVRTGCDPAVFYWGVRPWFRGGDSATTGALGTSSGHGAQTGPIEPQKGWHFEGVDAPGVRRVFTGPSAGQSSLVHALDVFLDVDHTRTKPRVGRPAPPPPAAAHSETEAGAPSDATFMERMQLYMPSHHRNFLTHLRTLSFDEDEEDDDDYYGHPRPPTSRVVETAPVDGMDIDAPWSPATPEAQAEQGQPHRKHPIRSLAMADPPIPGRHDDLRPSYDGALHALKRLRDEHMRIATLYIVSQARKPLPPQYAPLPDSFTGRAAAAAATATANAAQAHAQAQAIAAQAEAAAAAKPVGTGGTDLVSFLKDCRTNTLDALLDPAQLAHVSNGPVTGHGPRVDVQRRALEAAANIARAEQQERDG